MRGSDAARGGDGAVDPVARRHGRGRGRSGFPRTLGVAKDAPVGFRAIRLRFELDSDATPEQLAKLVDLTERYCVVYQTLRQPPPLELLAPGR